MEGDELAQAEATHVADRMVRLLSRPHFRMLRKPPSRASVSHFSCRETLARLVLNCRWRRWRL